MPEACNHHVLNVSFLTVSKFNLCFLLAYTRSLPTHWAWFFGAYTGTLTTHRTRLGRTLLAYTRALTTLSAKFRFIGRAIPFRIIEMMICLHEIVYRKVVLAIVKACATSDDLLELNHRIDWPQQHDIA